MGVSIGDVPVSQQGLPTVTFKLGSGTLKGEVRSCTGEILGVKRLSWSLQLQQRFICGRDVQPAELKATDWGDLQDLPARRSGAHCCLRAALARSDLLDSALQCDLACPDRKKCRGTSMRRGLLPRRGPFPGPLRCRTWW